MVVSMIKRPGPDSIHFPITITLNRDMETMLCAFNGLSWRSWTGLVNADDSVADDGSMTTSLLPSDEWVRIAPYASGSGR